MGNDYVEDDEQAELRQYDSYELQALYWDNNEYFTIQFGQMVKSPAYVIPLTDIPALILKLTELYSRIAPAFDSSDESDG